jgi:hypothetical protein
LSNEVTDRGDGDSNLQSQIDALQDQIDELNPPPEPGCTPDFSGERFELVLNGDGVLDKHSCLIWEQRPDQGFSSPTDTLMWDQAVVNCTNLVKGGEDDWSLPTITEFQFLVDPTKNNPALPEGHPFVDVLLGNHWTSTPGPTNGEIAVMNLQNGNVTDEAPTATLSAWCVHPLPAP